MPGWWLQAACDSLLMQTTLVQTLNIACVCWGATAAAVECHGLLARPACNCSSTSSCFGHVPCPVPYLLTDTACNVLRLLPQVHTKAAAAAAAA